MRKIVSDIPVWKPRDEPVATTVRTLNGSFPIIFERVTAGQVQITFPNGDSHIYSAAELHQACKNEGY